MIEKWVLVISDAWEQQHIYTFEATGITTAYAGAQGVLTYLNSKDDAPLYMIDAIVKESVLSAFGIEATGTGNNITVEIG